MATGPALNFVDNTAMIDHVFIKHKDIAGTVGDDIEQIKSYEVCVAMGKIIGAIKVEGAQRIGGVWELYTISVESRVNLVLRQNLLLRNKLTPLFDKHPFDNQNQQQREKIVIKGLPLRAGNEALRSFLLEKNIDMLSDIKYSYNKNDLGTTTNFKNGDRYVFAAGPIMPLLPRTVDVDGFRCKVFHDSQFQPSCKICNLTGHTEGEPQCEARNVGQQILLSSRTKTFFQTFFLVT